MATKILTKDGLTRLWQLINDKLDNKLDKAKIVNDLTTGGIDKALSAEQGKVLFQSVDNGKQLLANAIIGKGRTGVSKDSSFAELAGEIKAIESRTDQTTNGRPFNTSNLTNIKTFVANNQSRMKVLPAIFDTSQMTDMRSLFSECEELIELPMIDTGNVTNMRRLFEYCTKLKRVPALNTSRVTNMQGMFFACKELETIPLIDTSQVVDMTSMFNACEKLKEVPLLDLSRVTNYGFMFRSCLSLDIPKMRSLGWPEKYLQTAPYYTAP